jgi:hypothetical protein
LRSINDVVLAQTVGPARLGSTGLSIYFPPNVELLAEPYLGIPAAASWNQFLAAYYDAGAAIPPEAQPAVVDAAAEGSQQTGEFGEVVFADATVVEVEGGYDVSVQLDPESLPNVVDASLSFGYVDPDDGAVVLLGDNAADIFDDGTVSGFTDLTVFTMTDIDGDTVDAYFSFELNEDGTLAFASVPLEYQAPGSDVWEPVDLSIVIDLETGDIVEEIYYLIDESGSYGELTADPEGLIQPVVLVLTADGGIEWQSYGDTAVFADLPNLQYDFQPLDPALEFYVDISVTDFGGNELIASSTFFV